MKAKHYLLLRFPICLLVVLFSISFVHCVGIGLSPSEVVLPNVLRGGYAEKEFSLSNPAFEEMAFTVEIDGQEDWFSFEPYSSGYLPARSTLDFKIIARPPSYVPVGNYTATLKFYATTSSSLSMEGAGSKVIAGVAIPINITLSDLQILSYISKEASIPLSEECYPIKIYVDVENDGNIRVNPNFIITIFDSSKNKVKEVNYTAEEILPTVSKRLTVDVSYEIPGEYRCIPQGKYNVTVDSYLNGEKINSFNRTLEILERGSITIRGNITNLSHSVNTTTDQLTKISTNFTNIGEMEVGAKLKAELYLDGTLSDVVEGDIVRIAPHETGELTAYFKPKQAGTYNITAWAVFEGKTTDKINSSIIVAEKPLPILEISIFIIVLIVIISVIVWWKRRQNY